MAVELKPEQVAAFADLFAGNPVAHYVRTADGKYEAVERGITDDDIARHLRGDAPSLLSIPIDSTGRSHFGVIDVDRHAEDDEPVNYEDLARKITELHLPLVPFRSKNGKGAWLVLFLKEKEGYLANVVRQLLNRYVKILEITGEVEIFPKQETLNEGQKGNGVNIGYFGSARPAFGKDGSLLGIDEFISLALERRAFGSILATRDLTAAPTAATPTLKSDPDNPLPLVIIRELHKRNLENLRKTAKGARNVTLNTTCYFAGRAFAAGALEGTEEEIKSEIRKIGQELKMSDTEFSGTAASGWNTGAKHPLVIQDPEQHHADVLVAVDAMLSDEKSALPHLAELARNLAALAPLEYAERRKALAKRYGVRPGDLDKEVGRIKAENAEDDGLQGQAVNLVDIEPWPEPVDGAKLLDELSQMFKRHIYFPHPTDADALALWVVLTHCRDCFTIVPYIGITSPTKACGKSSLLEILKAVSYRAILASNITPAAVFRVVDLFKPTLLVDELDTFLEKSSEFVGILNSGHKKAGAYVYRVVGDQQEVREFCTWGPKAFGMIGVPPGTIASRSISVRLLRKKASEKVESFDDVLQAPDLERIRRQLARWSADNKGQFQSAEVNTAEFSNRLRDNWRPLLTIAGIVGKAWVERALVAARATAEVDDEDLRTILMRDVRNIFHTRKTQRIPSELLVFDLLRQKNSPWMRLDHGQEMNQYQMAKLLRDMGVIPHKVRQEKELAGLLGRNPTSNLMRGYDISQFTDLFDRFLADEEAETVDVSQGNEVLS